MWCRVRQPNVSGIIRRVPFSPDRVKAALS